MPRRGRSRRCRLVPRRGRSRACIQAAVEVLRRHGLRHVRRRLGEQALHKNGCISERLVMLLQEQATAAAAAVASEYGL